jgi:hypothetical protein
MANRLIDAEDESGEIIIKASSPTKEMLGIDGTEVRDRSVIDFWDCVANTWNKKYGNSIMIMKRLNRGESGVCNEDESIQFRPMGGNNVVFRNGKLTIRNLRRVAECISKSIKEITGRNDYKVEVKFKASYYSGSKNSH